MRQLKSDSRPKVSGLKYYSILLIFVVTVAAILYWSNFYSNNSFLTNYSSQLICNLNEKSAYNMSVSSELNIIFPTEKKNDANEVQKQILSHLRFLITSVEKHSPQAILEMDLSKIDVTYVFENETKNSYQFTYERNQDNNLFRAPLPSLKKSVKSIAKRVKYNAKLSSIVCGSIDKNISFNLPKKPYLVHGTLNNIPKSCLRPEYSSLYDHNLVWFFWNGNRNKCPASDLTALAEVSFVKNNESTQLLHKTVNFENTDKVVTLISPDISLKFDNLLVELKNNKAIEIFMNSENTDKAKLFLEGQSYDPSFKTFLIMLWSIKEMTDLKKFTLNFSSHHIRAHLYGKGKKQIEVYFLNPFLNEPIENSSIMKSAFESGLLIYTGHALLGQSYLDKVLTTLSSNKSYQNKMVAVISCHSYMYYGYHGNHSVLRMLMNTGEIFDYEGKYALSLLADYWNLDKNAFMNILMQQKNPTLFYLK